MLSDARLTTEIGKCTFITPLVHCSFFSAAALSCLGVAGNTVSVRTDWVTAGEMTSYKKVEGAFVRRCQIRELAIELENQRFKKDAACLRQFTNTLYPFL